MKESVIEQGRSADAGGQVAGHGSSSDGPGAPVDTAGTAGMFEIRLNEPDEREPRPVAKPPLKPGLEPFAKPQPWGMAPDMMLPGIMSGAVLSWITCINELSSSIMLYSGKTSTIAVAIYQEVVRMSDGTAAALATILTLTTIVSLVIVFRATKGKVKIV